ncbi:MAG TPA: phosphoadenylyl-sulfate reductase [Afifellaceae bacterium]|nr:phosphoadenylyl-sulfate reductase [Afifellaceae bacterium]
MLDLPRRAPERTRRRDRGLEAQRLNQRFAAWATRDVLRAVIEEEIAGPAALVSSFGAESAVLLHMVAGIDPATPVIYIDTGKLFAATEDYRHRLVEQLGLSDIRVARRDPLLLRLEDAGSDLWRRDPDWCCAIRKVAPLAAALSGFGAWISGRKRYQGGARSELPLVEADGTRLKVNPLAFWSAGEVEAYRRQHRLPEHPLVADGFRSIGCEPCTDRVRDDESVRDGRWRGRQKSECGIHLALQVVPAGGKRHAMSPAAQDVWKDGAFREDEWIVLGAEEEEPPAGQAVIVPLARLLAERERFLGRNDRLGILVAAGEDVRQAADLLDRLSVVALDFPKFSDGRNMSTARRLREQLSFSGEVRAVGDVLADQIPLMRRCGIDAFVVKHEPTRRILAEGRLAEMRRYYQPVGTGGEVPAGTRPWARLPSSD